MVQFEKIIYIYFIYNDFLYCSKLMNLYFYVKIFLQINITCTIANVMHMNI